MEKIYKGEDCPNCQSNKWVCIPDSLASACEECGFVRVIKGKGSYIAGTTLQEWAKYYAETLEARDAKEQKHEET